MNIMNIINIIQSDRLKGGSLEEEDKISWTYYNIL